MANSFARKLCTEMTDAERKLWTSLRYKQLNGFRFRRQQPIGPFIADFFCPEAKLIVELDGDQHGSKAGMARDARRTTWLASRNCRVLRFGNHEIFKERERVIDVICNALETSPHPIRLRGSTSPSRGEVKAIRD